MLKSFVKTSVDLMFKKLTFIPASKPLIQTNLPIINILTFLPFYFWYTWYSELTCYSIKGITSSNI